jgi:hypothetical protein
MTTMTTTSASLSMAFNTHARLISLDTGISSSLKAARERLAGRKLERRAFATIVAAIWHPETTVTSTTAPAQEPTREEMDPEERRWQLEWERRNIED